jgi:uncharacterized membrane protein
VIKPLYTLVLFYDGSEHRTYSTTDKEKARKIYHKYMLKYGYAPRVWKGGVKLRIYQADELFKLKMHSKEHKALFARDHAINA